MDGKDHDLLARFYGLSAQEQKIVLSAAQDDDVRRSLSVCRLYFAGTEDARIVAFLKSMRSTT